MQVTTMVLSPSTTARQRMKVLDPERYSQYLGKQKERNKKKREELKNKWESKPQTRTSLQEHERVRDLARNRYKSWKERHQSGQPSRRSQVGASDDVSTPLAKKPRDISSEEPKEHRRLQHAKERMKETEQKEVTTMVLCPSTAARQRMKVLDPERYNQYLSKQKERNKKKREELKNKWESEPQTRTSLQEHERVRDLARNRYKRWKERHQSGRPSRGSQVGPSESDEVFTPLTKKPRDMTSEEFKAHRRLQRAKERMKESSQKQRCRKEKDREYQRKKRAAERQLKSPAPGPGITDTDIRAEKLKKSDKQPRDMTSEELKEHRRLQRAKEQVKESAHQSGRPSRRSQVGASDEVSTPLAKKPRDMTSEEFKAHRRLQRATERMKESAQKKRRRKEKDREYQRKKRAAQRQLKSPAPSLEIINTDIGAEKLKKSD